MEVDEETKALACKKLVNEVVERLTDNVVIMSSAPLAAVLLEFRKGILNDNLVKQVDWIFEELKARNALLSENTVSNRGTIHAMQYLEEFVRKKRDIFEPFVSPKVDYKNFLMLAYYK